MRHGSKREASISLSRHMSDNARAADSDEDMDDEDSPGSPTTTAPVQRLNRTETGDTMRWRFSQPDWAATGVMNNIPSRPTSTLPEPRREVSRQQHLKADFEARHKHTEEVDTSKAAELALREVLERIREANTTTAKNGVFDFDPYQLTFPSLCLKILPPPPTLSSPSPFPTHENWPIGPPGAKQWEALQRTIKEKVTAHERATQLFSGSPVSSSVQPSMELGRLQNHLNLSYHHWQGITDRQRQEAWQLEILRVYSTAEEGRKNLQKKLDVAMRANDQLRKELEDMRHARDFGEPLPVTALPPVAAGTASKMLEDGSDAQQWDYDSLLDKWKDAIKEGRRTTHGMAAQRRLSATPTVKLNNRKLNPGHDFGNLPEETIDSAAGTGNQTQHVSPNFNDTSQNMQHAQQHYLSQHPEPEIVQIDQPTPIHHPQPQLQHSSFPASQPPSSRPVSPPLNPHLTAQSAVRDQRRRSAQLSPNSMPSQSRRVSVQADQLSPLPTPHPQGFQQPPPPPPAPQEAHMSIMVFNTQPPALQIPQASATHPIAIPSPYSTTPIAQPPSHLQQWVQPPQTQTPDQQLQAQQMQHQISQETHRIQQQAQQMSQELQVQQMHVQQQQHQQMQHQMQTQSMPPTPVAPQGPYPSQIPDQQHFQQIGLQVPQPTDRRNSAPMIDAGHHAMMQTQVVESPASAGGYMGMRMQAGLENMAMGFSNSGMGMGMVNGTGAG